MERKGRIVRVMIPVVLVIGSVCVLHQSAVNCRFRVIENIDSTSERNGGNSPTASHRRYSTSDEMRYILYGDGAQFSPYDQRLLDYIRSHVTQQSPTRPRRLTIPPNMTDTSQVGQSAFVDNLLSGRRDGFFVECGAADGQLFSNSLFFELERNWTGLLIEANPYFHRALLERNRRAYVLRTCLSTERRPATVRFQPAGTRGGIVGKMYRSHLTFVGSMKKQEPEVEVNCFPLNAISAALGVSHVDYLSLDVEGPEVEILRTVDWTRLHVDAITVEYRVSGRVEIDRPARIDQPATLKRLEDLRRFFRETGIYKEVGIVPRGSDASGLDIVFSRI